MVWSMDQYKALREDFLSVAKNRITPADLNELKVHYERAINSVRTLDRIHDIEYLVSVLEKRGVIRFNNIAPLRYIARKYFGDSPINEKLIQYNTWLKSSNILSYLPHTNLYRLPNGESYLRNRRINDLSSTNSKKISPNNSNLQSHLNYQFSYKLPLHVISDKDLSNSDNSIISTSSSNDQCNAQVSFQRNVISNGDRDICIINENCDDRKLHVVHNVTIPPRLVLESEQSIILQSKLLTRPLIEQNSNENNNPVETSYLSTPLSHEAQTICSSQIDNTLSDQSLINSSPTRNLVEKSSLKKLIHKKEVRIALIVLFVGVMLSVLLIIYPLLENSVEYNPGPSAPPFQEVNFGSTEPSNNLHAGNHMPWILNNVTGLPQPQNNSSTCFPVKPRLHSKPLPESEEIQQQKVFERVSEMMGSYWRDIARLLGVRESQIDDIEQHNCNLTVKAHTALKIFARDGNPDNWRRELKQALLGARRKDLFDCVEDLLDRKQ